MAFCLINELAAELGIDPSITQDNALLTQALTDAQAFIEGPGGAGRSFQVTVDTTRTLDAIRDVENYLLTLDLDEDLCQITSITNGDGTSVSPSLYVTNPRNTTPWYALQFKWVASTAWTFTNSPENSISITGRWGYSTSAPADIHRAHKRLAAWYYRQKSSQADIDRPLLTPGGVTILPSKVPSDVMAILEPYRRRVSWV